MDDRAMYYRIIETPTSLEIYEYDRPIAPARANGSKRKEEQKADAEKDTKGQSSAYDAAAARHKRMLDNRWNVARLIDCNKGCRRNKKGELLGMKFLTLTIAEDSKDTHDVSWCNRQFSLFVHRLNDHIFGRKSKMQLEYLAVNERQKRGVWHYHVVLFHFPYIEKSELERLWGLGYIDIRSLERDAEGNPLRFGVSTYISKYFTKDVLRGYKKKTFFKSQNLATPKVLIVSNPAGESLNLDLDAVEEVFSKEYNRPFFDSDTGGFTETTVKYTKYRKDDRSEGGYGHGAN